MKKLPNILVGVVCIYLSFFLSEDVFAITIASQDQAFGDQLNSWEVIQELGNNLSGTLTTFTFRVSTTQTNPNQFDFTVQNSRIYDKENNSYITACTPSGYNPADPIGGLTFNTSGLPTGYEDVTLDFSCRNYNFTSGHRYLALISNATMSQFGGRNIQFAGAAYGAGGHYTADQFSGGGTRYAFNNGFCSTGPYVWNSQSNNNGCNIWTSAKDDLYFVLNNSSPPPKTPVVFIPGIGGSELKASDMIAWADQDDGHGGKFSHTYSKDEKVWVNQDEAVKLGDDDYFDALKLKPDGVTSEAALSLTGNLTSFGYGEIDSFFAGIGYEKGKNFFVFPYDWRKDVRTTKDDLDNLIEQAKTKSGQTKVNLVVHSMGGLIARYYISDSVKAGKVNKLIELGVPHLGAPFAMKSLIYGSSISYRFKFFEFPIIPSSEIKDVLQNFPSQHSLLPSNQYFSFYDTFPFRDDRDIDNNKITGVLNYDQTKSLLSNLGYNMTVFEIGEQFHTAQDAVYNQTNGVKVYEIAGTAQPTLGQIIETWLVTWPITLIPKQDEIFINGDDTVPLYSATLKSDSQDLSGAYKIYYVEQKHSDLVSSNGAAMQAVKSILNDNNSLPVEVKDQKIVLAGQQISVDNDANLDLYDDANNHTGLNSNGDVEVNIPNTFYDSLDTVKHIFVKKSSSKVTAKIKSSKSIKANIKIRNYSQDSINKTIFYNNVPVDNSSTIQFTVDASTTTAPTLSVGTQTILASAETSGSAALDQTASTTSVQISGTKDASGIYTGPVTVTMTGNDAGSGILRIEYSLDNGVTVQTYTGPFTISASGKTTLQVKSIDKLGNEEIPQTFTIEIAVPPTPTPTSSTSSSSSSGTNSSTSNSNTPGVGFDSPGVSSIAGISDQSSTSISSPPAVLGIEFKNPGHISDEINISNALEELKNSGVSLVTNHPVNQTAKQILSGLLIVSGGIVVVTSFGLAATFIHPTPK